MNTKKIISMVMALTLTVTMASCGKKATNRPSSIDPLVSITSSGPQNTLDPNFSTMTAAGRPTYVEKVTEKYAINGDTVGWLDVPGTKINDVVVSKNDPNDLNNYYYRRNFNKEYSFNGIFYADYRNKFLSGLPNELSDITVLYGHSMSEDPNGVMFGPMKNFIKEDFAKKTPYIYFTTRKQDLTWEIFSIMYTTVDMPYNVPDQGKEHFDKMIKESKERSIYNYGVDVTSNDKIIVLSTCTYQVNESPYSAGITKPYDSVNGTIYRYVILAKLVDNAKATKTEAKITENKTVTKLA